MDRDHRPGGDTGSLCEAESEGESKGGGGACASCWLAFLDGRLCDGRAGGGMDTVKLILSFVSFWSRGSAMRALSTPANVAAMHGHLFESFCQGGEDEGKNLVPTPRLIGAGEFLLRSAALVPGTI